MSGWHENFSIVGFFEKTISHCFRAAEKCLPDRCMNCLSIHGGFERGYISGKLAKAIYMEGGVAEIYSG